MKRMKKIFAFALAMVMMLAMNVTVFAETAEDAGTKTTVTVSNLSDREETQVSIYNIVSLAEKSSSWVVADWATDYVTVTGEEATYDLDGLKKAAVDATADATVTTKGETVSFDVSERGAYLVLATGESVVYNPMVATTYKYNDNGLMVLADAKVVAKGSDSVTEKEADDAFAAAGQTVNFTVTTTIPYFSENETDKEFYVTDKPQNLTDLTIKSVTVAGTEVEAALVENNGEYTLDLSDYVDKTGATVVIKYSAVVVGDKGYTNQAWTNKNDETRKSTTVTGWTGDITLTKYAEDGTTTLAGAQFVVSKEIDGKTRYAVFDESNESNVFAGWTDNKDNATVITTGTDGTVKVSGLDEGEYSFEEVVAPAGYSVNTTPVSATITAAEENVSVTISMIDTTLSALPATGGIGTTIFTIAGVAIMVAAAGLFFASRRKN